MSVKSKRERTSINYTVLLIAFYKSGRNMLGKKMKENNARARVQILSFRTFGGGKIILNKVRA
jgi:hypothetical protein